MLNRWVVDSGGSSNEDNDYMQSHRGGSSYSEDNNSSSRNNNNNNNSLSLENIEQIMSQMFGSCSSNLQSLFGAISSPSSNSSKTNHNSNKHRHRTGTSNRSKGTATTEESSTNSKRCRKLSRRSKSEVDYRRKRSINKTHDLSRRHRSMSTRSNGYAAATTPTTTDYDFITSLLPRKGIENTEIAVEHHDDDVSAISAYTLNEMYANEIHQVALANSKAKQQHSNNNSSSDNNNNNNRADDRTNGNHGVSLGVNINAHGNSNNYNNNNTCLTPTYDEYGKENISDVASHLSMMSSSETTEFESIWRTKSAGSPSSKSNADNCNANVVRRDSTSGLICRDNRYARNREIKRSPLTLIDENDLLYVDEEEI